MSKFQIALTGIFVICIIAGVALFATYKGGGNSTDLPSITIWGTLSDDIFDEYINRLNQTRANALKINYNQISENNFDRTFIEALARGQGPDAILIPQDLIYKHEDKIIAIPYDSLTRRDFVNTFIQQAELYLHPTAGTLALPFIIDPLVMYWNRDIFTNAGIAVFPKFWDEFTEVNQKITQKDANSNIRRSAIALGEFNNISHAREILGTLFLQAGNPITYRDPRYNNAVISGLGTNSNGLASSLPALDFFTKFSNPQNPEYSWNRSLPNSKNSFLSGNLATYIGLASEINDIRQKNPNLDFDIAPMPQARGGVNRASYGEMYGFSIVRSTANAGATYTVLNELISPGSLASMIELSYLPPVRRDMIAGGSTDPYLSIFYDSALISKGWLDTDQAESSRIFQGIVESVTSGRKSAREALTDGSDEFDISLSNI